jgi:hypothetical protein
MLPHIPTQQPYGGQGTLSFYVYAIDYEGHGTLLGRSGGDHTPTTVQLNNDAIAKPFGTLDTPVSGETISGTKAVFGWVLTPDSNTVADAGDILLATNGSGIVAYVDSVPMGQVTYNQCRDSLGSPPTGRFCTDDVANTFGQPTPIPPLAARSSNPTKYRNLDSGRGAIGFFVMDTTLLTNGVHTIGWAATDTASRSDGIGSRFFTVVNGGGGSVVTAESLKEALERPAVSRGRASDLRAYGPASLRVSSRTGFDMRTPMRELRADTGEIRRVVISALGRAELSFGGPVSGAYLVANGELRDLPIGASLDPQSGAFAWAPPAGYFGTYHLVFLVDDTRVDVEIVVGAAGSR